MPSPGNQSANIQDPYHFGPFQLDLAHRRILANGRPVSWRSQRHFDLLRTLVDAEPNVVSYQTLRDEVWHGKGIEPHTIFQTVKNLRAHLGIYEDCIRNQPGEGYYFSRPPSGPKVASNFPLEVATLLEVAALEFHRRSGSSILRALELYRRIVTLDPSCLQGQLGVAATIIIGCHSGFGVLKRTELVEARQAADIALSLAKANKALRAEAICNIAHIRLLYDWDLKGAERLLDKARRLDDRHAGIYQAYAHLYLITNRWSKVMDAIGTARGLMPSSPMLHGTAGLMLHFMRRYHEAIEMCKSVVSLHPRFSPGYVMLGLAYEADQQYGLAIESFEAAFGIEEHAAPVAALGHIHGALGKSVKARRALGELSKLPLIHPAGRYFHALIYAGLGKRETALNCLEVAFEEGCDWLIHLGVDPRWDDLHQSARFRNLVTRLGINQPA